MANKWITDPLDLGTYIRLVKTSDTNQPVDSISEIDLNPYVLTNYGVGDYVLRRYPATKIGHSNPDKYGSWWRGPFFRDFIRTKYNYIEIFKFHFNFCPEQTQLTNSQTKTSQLSYISNIKTLSNNVICALS